jgi:hypothetical protein
MSVLLTVARPTKRLDIADIIRSTIRKRDDVVFSESSLFPAEGAAVAENRLQIIPVSFRMATSGSTFCCISPSLKVCNIGSVSQAIIPMIHLLRCVFGTNASIRRLFVEWQSFLSKERITGHAAKMAILSSILRWFTPECLTTVAADGIYTSVKSKTYLALRGITDWQMQPLSTHAYIIPQLFRYENPELLESK